MAKVIKFEDLDVWKEGRELTRRIYKCSRNKQFSRDFSLRDQIRGAAISVTSNIAEGFDAQSNSEFVRFLNYSRRSISEVKSQLYVALDENYIERQEFAELYELASKVSKMLFGFIRYLKTSRRKPS